MRPVRVEARVFETRQGYPIWQAMEESVYAHGALKTLPETVRDKKEIQLYLNLAETMESLGELIGPRLQDIDFPLSPGARCSAVVS